ncbi:MAG TPA: N-acetylmuramoyl-L-alanine amidase [Polyangia bacterium]|nr:N-acetylmuramoyl-L-alanine amidase [Polyangia bacterium]
MKVPPRNVAAAAVAALVLARSAAVAEETPTAAGTSIIVAGQPFQVGRPVVLWRDPQGFDAYQTRCIDQTGGCCDGESKRYGTRKGVEKGSLDELQTGISQLVLHFDGCVNSRSCFKSMHNRPRPSGNGCGLSAHFMIDADGTIYQTLDLVERAFHAEIANSDSIGVEICNRGRVDRSEWPKLPADYRTRVTREVTINGDQHEAYEFRPEQYESIIALTRTLLRVFPKIKPIIPEGPDGKPIMDTLSDPLSFAGIMGHLHIERKKWDPGALDWSRILRALNGFELPVQIRSFTELPRTQADLLAARRAAFFNAEERATGFFPVAADRLWHSGVHLRAALGAPVRAPVRGRIVAVRRAAAGVSSASLVLIRHDVDVGDGPFTFYSLLAHLDLPARGTPEAGAIPWMQALPVSARGDFDAGRVVVLDERVEAGDTVGYVGTVSRGPEEGPEVHFEIFSTEKLPGEMGKAFHYVNASDDGAIVRRADLVAPEDGNGDQEVDGAELERFFKSGNLDRRQALRRAAIRHRHEWGDRDSEESFSRLRELAGLSAAQRRQLYQIAVAPYVFWTDDLSRATGLPQNQTIYSYNALTFLLQLSALSNHVALPTVRVREIGEARLEPRQLRVTLADWTNPRVSPLQPRLFGPPLGIRLAPRSKDEIPLIELAPTDNE